MSEHEHPRDPNAGEPTRSDEQTRAQAGGEDRLGKGPAVRQVDHYVLLDEIGQGGMGVVYRANDTRLGRIVAVKVLQKDRDQVQGTQGRRRFVTEARITGRLQHPGVPPVHDLGTLADGRPFLAMKLVQGETLRKLLQRRSDPAEELGRFVGIFEQICHAVGYAHTHEVIHRDLKPANVMVGSHGEVQVMDWGLAKVMGRQVESSPAEFLQGTSAAFATDEAADTRPPTTEAGGPSEDQSTLTHQLGPGGTPDQGDSETRMGQVLGTPAYMAPEQARGEVHLLDARCDVFGLGAILCEILTGRPPYTGRSVQEVLRKACQGELHEAWQRLDSCRGETELVELCRQCLAPEKETRPRDGNQVARAVGRIRQQAQQRARQAELERAEALVREAEQRKRRRHLLWAAAVVVLVLVVGVVGTTLGMLRAEWNRQAAVLSERRARQSERQALADRDAKSRALDKLQQALLAEQEARQSEQQARQQAMAALRFMTDDAVRDEMAAGGRLPAHRRRYLEKVIRYYEGFARIRGQREEARAIRAEGFFRVGNLQLYLGEKEQARRHLEQSVQIYRQLVQEYPSQEEYRIGLIDSLNRLAWLLSQSTERFEEAETLAQEAIRTANHLAGQRPREPRFWKSMASAHGTLAVVCRSAGRFTQAIHHHRQALVLYQKLAQRFPDLPEYQNALAITHNNLGNAFRNIRRYAEAEKHHRQAIRLKKKLVRRFPQVVEYRSGLATSHNNLGNVYRSVRRYAEAEKHHRQAIRLYQALAEQFPRVPLFQSRLADGYNNLAALAIDTRRHAEAVGHYRQAIRLHEQLAGQFPGMLEFRSRLADEHNALAATYENLRRFSQSENHYRQAIQLLERLVQKLPQVPLHQVELARTHYRLGTLFQNTSRPAEAEKHYRQALDLLREPTRRFPDSPDPQSILAGCYYNLGLLHQSAERRVEAEKCYRRAIEHRKQLVQRFPRSRDFRSHLASSYNNLGNVYHTAGQHRQAEECYRQAIQVCEELLRDFPRVPSYQHRLAMFHANLGTTYQNAGRHAEAEKHFRRAIQLRQGLLQRFPTSPEYRSNLAQSHRALGSLYRDTRRHEAAEEHYRRAIQLRAALLRQSSGAPSHRHLLALEHLELARLQQAAGRNDEAVKTFLQAAEHFQQLARTMPDNPVAPFNAACCLALASRAASRQKQPAEAERNELSQTYARQAVEQLRQAVKRGFRNVEQLKKDADLDVLRQREDFQKLLTELEAALRAGEETKPIDPAPAR